MISVNRHIGWALKGAILVTYTVYNKMCSLQLTALWSSGQPQRSALGPSPDSEPVPRSRVLTGDTSNMHVLTVATGCIP